MAFDPHPFKIADPSKTTYSFRFKCDNCGRPYIEEIPKGIRADHYYPSQMKMCKGCGVYIKRTLPRSWFVRLIAKWLAKK